MSETARDALLGGQAGYSQDFRCFDRPGSIRWLHEDVHAAPTGENAWRVVGVTADVTELVQAREALEQSEADRRVLLQRVMTAQEEERANLARELHDPVGQELSGILLGMKVALAVPTLEDAQKQLSSLRDQTSEAIESVRQMAFDIRPGSLEELGLVVALRQELHAMGRAAGVRVRFSAPAGEELGLPPEAEIALYRVVRGALTNSVQHARAKELGIAIDVSEAHVTVVATDDGVGFDVDALMSSPTAERFGILAMQERVEMLSGTLRLESAQGEGTTVSVSVPVDLPWMPE